MVRQIDRIDEFIKTFGSITCADSLEIGIGNFSARMSQATKIYPIKRVEVQRKSKNRFGVKPKYYRYYYDKNKLRVKNYEKVVKWLDE